MFRNIFCMHSFGALIGQVVRRQNVICDTPTSLGAREQPDNLILTRLATNAGHRAMSNLHSTNLQSTIPPWSTTPSTPSTLPTWSPAQHLPDTNPRTCQVTTTTCSSKPGGEPNFYQPWSLPSVMQRQKSVFFSESIFRIVVPMILISQDHKSTFIVVGSTWAFIALVGSQFLRWVQINMIGR